MTLLYFRCIIIKYFFFFDILIHIKYNNGIMGINKVEYNDIKWNKIE